LCLGHQGLVFEYKGLALKQESFIPSFEGRDLERMACFQPSQWERLRLKNQRNAGFPEIGFSPSALVP